MRYNRYRSHGPPAIKPKQEIIDDVEVIEIQPPRGKEIKEKRNTFGGIKNIFKKFTGDINFEDILLIGLILLLLSEEEKDNDTEILIPILIYIYLG